MGLKQGFFILCFVAAACSEQERAPLVGKPETGLGTKSELNKLVNIKFKDALDESHSAHFQGSNFTTPSCMIGKPSDAAEAQVFSASIPFNKNILEVNSKSPATTIETNNFGSFYNIVRNAQSGQNIPANQILLTNVELAFRVNNSPVYESASCNLKVLRASLLAESAQQLTGQQQGVVMIANCSRMEAEDFDKTIKNAQIQFSCVVAESN